MKKYTIFWSNFREQCCEDTIEKIMIWTTIIAIPALHSSDMSQNIALITRHGRAII